MQNNNANLMCIQHPKHHVASINLDQNNGGNSRLQCSSCLINLLNQNQNQKQNCYSFVDIDEFMENPISQLQRVLKYDGSKAFSDLDYLQQFEKEINLIEDKFKQTIIGLRECVKQLRNLKDKFQQDFQEQLNLNTLIEQYNKLRYLQNSDLKTIQRKNFEEQLNLVCQNINQAKQKACENGIKSQEVISNMFQNYLKTLIKDINRLQQVSTTAFKWNYSQGLPILIYGELKNFPQIHNTISEGKEISYQLLYQGTKDGLNLEQFYSKCSRYCHLLTIITTKNGNKFGGYSPCLLKNNQFDAQLKSFLFSYDFKEIYKIKNQQASVYYAQNGNCKIGFGFGDGDLVFDGSLTKCSSNLGMSYDISNHNVYDRSTHIFGESNPQIQEFKVYKVIFQ